MRVYNYRVCAKLCLVWWRLCFAVALSILTPSCALTPQLLLIVNDPVSSRLYRRKLYKLDLSRGLWVCRINQGLGSFSSVFIFSFCSYNSDEILSDVVALRFKSADQDVWRGVKDDNFPSLFVSNWVLFLRSRWFRMSLASPCSLCLAAESIWPSNVMAVLGIVCLLQFLCAWPGGVLGWVRRGMIVKGSWLDSEVRWGDRRAIRTCINYGSCLSKRC